MKHCLILIAAMLATTAVYAATAGDMPIAIQPSIASAPSGYDLLHDQRDQPIGPKQ